ncbi:MAG: hypothetical protein K0Q95_2058 [Bacteroidota bacterium]|jgi:hypothetical protein|nr:hypothetical protein [Bacteroidota bacterium]
MTEEQFSVIKTVSSGTIYKRKDGILVYRPDSAKDSVTVQELEEQHNAFLKIQKGERSPLMVIAGKLRKLEDNEKRFIVTMMPEFASKYCVVTNTYIPTFIFNIFIFLMRPPIPGKIFKTETEALEWLSKDLI